MASVEKPKLKLLTEADLRELLSVSRSTIYRLVRSGALPPGLRIGPRSLRWSYGSIEAWLKNQEKAK